MPVPGAHSCQVPHLLDAHRELSGHVPHAEAHHAHLCTADRAQGEGGREDTTSQGAMTCIKMYLLTGWVGVEGVPAGWR